MAFRIVFGGEEGNPLEFVQFENETVCPCTLCTEPTKKGILIAHSEGSKLAFCHSCFGFLQEGFDSIKERQLAAHARENEEVRT